MRCLAPNAADRFPSAAELRDALLACSRRPKKRWKGFALSFGFGKRRFRLQIGTALATAVVAASVWVTQGEFESEPADDVGSTARGNAGAATGAADGRRRVRLPPAGRGRGPRAARPPLPIHYASMDGPLDALPTVKVEAPADER